jgi:hypothetical protein
MRAPQPSALLYGRRLARSRSDVVGGFALLAAMALALTEVGERGAVAD